MMLPTFSMDFQTSINLIKKIPQGHTRRPTQSRQSLIKALPQVILECVKLATKTITVIKLIREGFHSMKHNAFGEATRALPSKQHFHVHSLAAENTRNNTTGRLTDQEEALKR